MTNNSSIIPQNQIIKEDDFLIEENQKLNCFETLQDKKKSPVVYNVDISSHEENNQKSNLKNQKEIPTDSSEQKSIIFSPESANQKQELILYSDDEESNKEFHPEIKKEENIRKNINNLKESPLNQKSKIELIDQDEDDFDVSKKEETHNDYCNVEKETYQELINSNNNITYKSYQNDDNLIYVPSKDLILNIMNLFNKILNNNPQELQGEEYYLINDKGQVKEMIGYHKLYEITYIHQDNKREIKCYRRYDNFFQFHKKLTKKYPYFIIPKLTPKNALTKIISVSNEFYENRRNQLMFYLNFISHHPKLKLTREFSKFISDPNFDNNFFQINSSDSLYISYNQSTSSMLKNTLFSMWNYLGNTAPSHKMNDSEIQIKKLSIHYKNILDKSTEIKNSICSYVKTIKSETEQYTKLSETFFYLKDTFHNVENSQSELLEFSEFCKKISLSNSSNYAPAVKLQNKVEALISLLDGICFSLEEYCNFIKHYEQVEQQKNSIHEGKTENIAMIINEFDSCTILKNKYEQSLTVESEKYIQLFEDATNDCIKAFKLLLIEINKKAIE